MTRLVIKLYVPGTTDAALADAVVMASRAAKTDGDITWLIGEDGQPESAIISAKDAEIHQTVTEMMKHVDIDALRKVITGGSS